MQNKEKMLLNYGSNEPMHDVNFVWFIVIGIVFSGLSLKWLYPIYSRLGLLGKPYTKHALIAILIILLSGGLAVEILSDLAWLKVAYFMLLIGFMPNPFLFDRLDRKP
jgi:hypothetical protein